MRASVAGSWRLGILVWLALCVVPARRVCAEALRLQVRYELNAPACPDSARFVAGIEARLGHKGAWSARPMALRVTSHGGRVRGELVVFAGAQTIARQIEAASCTEAVDALALVAVLLLSPSSDAAPRPRAPGPSAPATRPDPAMHAAQRARPPEQAVEPLPAQEQAQVRQTELVSPARESDPPVHAPEASAPGTSAPAATVVTPAEQASPAANARALRASLALGAQLIHGVAPELRPGAALSTQLAWQRARLELGAELGVRAAWPYRSEREAGVLHFAFWSAAVRACSLGLFARGRLGLSGCVASELGQLHAKGSETRDARSARTLWSALGPALSIELRWGRRLWLRAGPELLFAMRRPTYTLADKRVFSVPPVTIRLELSLGVQFL